MPIQVEILFKSENTKELRIGRRVYGRYYTHYRVKEWFFERPTWVGYGGKFLTWELDTLE